MMRVYFSRLSEYTTAERVETNLYQLLGNIGGVMGLFIGVSFCTVLEFIEFAFAVLFYLVYKSAYGRRNTHKTQPID